MTDEVKAVPAAASAAPEGTAATAEVTEPETAANAKEAIYISIGEFVKTKTGKRIGKTGGREIFDMVVNGVFSAAVKDESFRFNGGMGSLHMKTYQPGSRRLPSGTQTTFGERRKVRYEQGVIVTELVANGGDLAAALKKRGAETAKAPAPKAKAPAKAAAPKKEAAKPAPAKTPAAASTAAAPPSQPNNEAELDLS